MASSRAVLPDVAVYRQLGDIYFHNTFSEQIYAMSIECRWRHFLAISTLGRREVGYFLEAIRKFLFKRTLLAVGHFRISRKFFCKYFQLYQVISLNSFFIVFRSIFRENNCTKPHLCFVIH